MKAHELSDAAVDGLFSAFAGLPTISEEEAIRLGVLTNDDILALVPNQIKLTQLLFCVRGIADPKKSREIVSQMTTLLYTSADEPVRTLLREYYLRQLKMFKKGCGCLFLPFLLIVNYKFIAEQAVKIAQAQGFPERENQQLLFEVSRIYSRSKSMGDIWTAIEKTAAKQQTIDPKKAVHFMKLAAATMWDAKSI